MWQPGTFYNPGATVRRVSTPPVSATPIANADFESGDTLWTKDAGWTIGTGANFRTFNGAYSARWFQTGSGRIVSQTHAPVTPGQVVIANCRVRRGEITHNQAGARVELEWLDSGQAFISRSQGNMIQVGRNIYELSTVTGTAPANAAFVRIGAFAFRDPGHSGNSVWVDTFTWSYAFSPQPEGLVFTAVQPDAGFSGATEPVWPTVNGQQVVDNEVTWEALTGSRVIWEANAILVSGYDEPLWPLAVGGGVVDNTIVWEAISRRVTDARCPNKIPTIIAASKVFNADDDIIAFSATVNPLDWSTAEDAGYLPFGLQAYGANPVTALGLYRSNLVAFNSTGFQMWQIDEDPANMALLDAVPVGCTQPRTVKPVQNDLVFLSAVGVRNIGIAGASTNLQAGTFGEAVDPLVSAAIKAGVYTPHATFVPSRGQYWLFFGPEAFVLTITDVKAMSWSRYVFPEAITDTTLLDDDLVLRTETGKVWFVSDDETADDVHIDEVEESIPFEGVIHWLHLDFGALGVEKQFLGFDLVANAPEGVRVSIGYDQRDVNARTADYSMEGDSLPGQMVPIPVSGPSFDLRVTFEANQVWEWQAAVMYIQDMRPGT